jgi:type IV secretion system protein VirB4
MFQAIGSSALCDRAPRRSPRREPRFEGQFGDAFSAALDTAWRDRLATRRLFVNDLYLTLVIRPLRGRARWADKLLGVAGEPSDQGERAADLRLSSTRRASS